MIKKLIQKFNEANFPQWLEFLSVGITGILFAILFAWGFVK